MASRAQAEAPSTNTRPINAVLEVVKSSAPDTQGRLVLAQALLGSSDEAALADHPPNELATLVDHAMAFLQEKPTGAAK